MNVAPAPSPPTEIEKTHYPVEAPKKASPEQMKNSPDMDAHKKQASPEMTESTEKARKNIEDIDKKLEEIKQNDAKGLIAEIKTSGSKKEEEVSEHFEEEFEIEEDLPSDRDLAESQENIGKAGFGQSESMGGVTVSGSVGIDPSIDSLALESYDYIEPVERLR
jgi:hypothetical protein